MRADDWDDGAALVTRMLRIWQAGRALGENPLPRMHEVSAPLVAAPEFVPACDSLFALTEAVLGRSLRPGRCCSRRLSRDEAAMLIMLQHAPEAGAVRTSAAVPHGLPAALRWAAFAVMRALGAEGAAAVEPPPLRCPFGGGPLLERAA
ncbi:MAG: hypothetical protein B7Z08_00015 [Sphingomonadales bacterium 32-68-7]|nr:MAG: hypothetical protein B7Z33_08340 [Sphingomonadales bacterium 12-68-11]OYX10619.1 MAG: hypothetical protein B7Z08_00015 [Sphingomonadales bacterium 32-68-7]